MKKAIAIANDVYWIGANDRETDLFESMWPLPRGVSYNCDLVAGGKTALMDTVKEASLPACLERLEEARQGGRTVDYLVVHHLEPDHSGALPFLLSRFPEMQIVGNAKTAEFLAHIHRVRGNVRVVKDGDELDLGGKTLKFFLTPMVHWPETMMTYVPQDKLLFSGDAFGGFGALDGDIFDDRLDLAFAEDEILRYFSNIVGKYAVPVQKAIAKLSGTEVRLIAPTHGPVWRKDPGAIVSRYDRWSRQEGEPGVVLAYGSMYGATERIMEEVAAGVREAGVDAVRVHDVARSHVSYVLRDIWRYKGLVLGTPTYDTGVFPPVDALIRLLDEKKLKNRVVGLFGTYGWSGGGVSGLKAFAEANALALAEPVVEARFSATGEELEKARQLGRNVAAAVLR
jgi:flavorubredoxin